MASEYPARGAAGQSADRAARVAGAVRAAGAARAARRPAGRHAGPPGDADPSGDANPSGRTGPSAPVPAAALAAVGDALLTVLWTATRDLDAHPGRRRLARGVLALAIAPRAAAELRTARPGDLAPSAPGQPAVPTDVPTDVPSGLPTRPASTPIAWGVGGTLAALTLAGSHWAEAAAVRRLRDRGVPHAGTVLGVALGVVQLLGTAGMAAAARRAALRGQVGWTQR